MDERFIGHITLELKALQEDATNVSSEWNGKYPGIVEDRASCADEINQLAGELIEMLAVMQEYGTSNAYFPVFDKLLATSV